MVPTAQVFEMIMLICFGLSWPFNIAKSLRSRTAKGKSLWFEVCIIVGYLLAAQLRSVRLTGAADAASASRLETLQELYNYVVNEWDGLKDQLTTAQKELEDYRSAAASGDGS